ncbi:hypothetical protein BAnh1_02730 [Bartonella australis AUST/NH1]|uniref:Uncharacterized protein n=1 Tax=Bartonella australis (strain Aust/NH1) TaxID=1094489 RepID=M1PBZ6_BARAA|nr:DUF1561 family protein [Bartonella australis]AGF74156.1 hypothetical protein BAnh1_02730 [Bartonella australis AUST/NH1]
MKRCEVPRVGFCSDGWRLTSKINLRFSPFFFAFLLSLHSLSAAPVPKVEQKLVEAPVDKAIRVKVHNGGEYCYAPVFVRGYSYVYIDKCSSSKVKFGRYDVFQRVGWNIKNVWLCMTAPGSVTGIDGSGTANWDYIMLRPCVINDPNQRWIVKDNAFYTADGKFRVKDYLWYTYISKNKEDYYDHTLDSSMDHWVNTVAVPGNMSFKTSIGWKFVTSSGFDMYYVSDNGSKSDVFDLYYNPESGHIARYFPTGGLLGCMSSEQSPSEDWNWVEWRFCYDVVPKEKHRGFWDISFLAGREGPIFDRNGNILRIPQYGPNWGRPYTAKPGYVKQDTTSSPKSEFVLSHDIERWNRYAMANAEDALTECPAPGTKPSISGSKKRVKRTLPTDFKLTEEWKKRLYDITISTAGLPTGAGMCGTCFLQTFQMIAELQESYPRSPGQRRGYFFDTAPNTDPFISLRNRFPRLFRALQFAPLLYGVPLSLTENSEATVIRAAAATTQVALPNFIWLASSVATGQQAIRESIQRLVNAPVGTIWISVVSYTLSSGGVIRHAVPILRASTGVVVIPTNVPANSLTFEAFSRDVEPSTNVDTILGRFDVMTGASMTTFGTLLLVREETDSLSVSISQNNCTGEGEGRRGSGREPSSRFLNQCTSASGRCSIF